MTIEVGQRIRINRDVWVIDKLVDNWVHISNSSRKKVIPAGSAESYAKAYNEAGATATTGPREPDAVSRKLDGATAADLPQRVIELGYSLTANQIQTLENLPNNGMRRMYVGNIVRKLMLHN